MIGMINERNAIMKVFSVIKPRTVTKELPWPLRTEEAKILFNALPSEIWQWLVESFKELDFKSWRAKKVLEYLRANSEITELVYQQPSSALTFEFLYHKKKPELPIDKYFVAAKAAQAIYDRLQTLKRELPNIIRKEIQKQQIEEFTILNIGSGPSHEMIEILANPQNEDLQRKVKVICIEPDKEALEIGWERVKNLGLHNNFIYIPKKLEEYYPESPANMLLMIGILCPVPTRVCVKILRSISYYTTFNNLIVFSTVQKIMGEEDPLCDYIMRLAGWKMDYKDSGEPGMIALKSGWKPVYYFFDKFGFNCMTVARLNLISKE